MIYLAGYDFVFLNGLIMVQTPKCWDYRYEPSFLVRELINFFLR